MKQNHDEVEALLQILEDEGMLNDIFEKHEALEETNIENE